MTETRFHKVLVANRGEIAVRVMRGVREAGLQSVAVFSDADRGALHVRTADEAVHIGPAPPRQSYLDIEKIIDACRQTGADAVHPGYGFLSENADFARALDAAGIHFIGPPADAIEAMGEKTRARELAIEAGVPVSPGTRGAIDDAEGALEKAREIGFPVLLKAAAGGGGKGMRRVDAESDFVASFDACRREAINAFGDGRIYLEKFIVEPRHTEIQILADEHGNVRHLFERDCSIQRRHQKVIEEAPSPVLRDDVRQEMGRVACQLAEAVGYVGAGTVEFLTDADQNFYFIEMNTRLQVEHPVTEWITGVDLVAAQIDIAQGKNIDWSQEDLTMRGAAIECRIYAEDPATNFMPSPGHIARLSAPTGFGVRDDSGYEPGSTVPVHYDPLVSKLVVWGRDRDRAIRRMIRALDDYVVLGIRSNVGFHRLVMEHPDFISGNYSTGFIPQHLERGGQLELQPPRELRDVASIAAAVSDVMQVRASTTRGRRAADDGETTRDEASPWRMFARYRRLARS